MARTYIDYWHRGVLLRKATKCIFCGATPPKLTNEHVFPVWSHRFMRPRVKGRVPSYQGVEYLDRKDVRIIKLPGQVRDWQIRCVCERCNNGWMRRIEDEARPIMIPLIQGHRARLSPSDQTKIATWAALKAMVADFDHGVRVASHHMHRRWLMTKRRSPKNGWAIWIGHFERVNWIPEWISLPFLILPEKVVSQRASREARYANGKTTTQTIGKLFIQVVHTSMPGFVNDWRFPTPHGGALFRIWPETSTSIKWPGTTLSDGDADNIASALHNFLLGIGRGSD